MSGLDGFSRPDQHTGDPGKWDMLGKSMQVLNIALEPGQTIQTEPGSMMYMSADVKNDVDCSSPCSRCCGGNPCIMSTYTNDGGTPGYIGVTPAVPSDLIAIDLAQEGGDVSSARGSYLTSIGNVNVDMRCQCCEMPIMPVCVQQLKGDGTAFVGGMGTVEIKDLSDGEVLVLDETSIMAWTGKLGYKCVSSPYACCCNGEGCCYATVTGPGKVWTKSYNFGKYKATMGVTVHLDENGNIKSVGAPDAPDADETQFEKADIQVDIGAGNPGDAVLSAMGIDKFAPPATDKYEIFGEDMQILRFKLAPGDKVTAEPGAMVYMSNDVKADCSCNDGCKRCMGGSPCCMGTFEGADAGAYLALTPNRPARVIPIALDGQRTYKAKDRAYLASTGDVQLDFEFNNLTNCCCAGQGCVNQIIKGEGQAFLGAMGELVMKYVPDGETVVVDTESVVAWEDTVKMSIRKTGGCCAMCCGGEGLFNTTLTGPGTIYVQSYSHSKFKQYAANWVLANRGKAGAGAPPPAETIER